MSSVPPAPFEGEVDRAAIVERIEAHPLGDGPHEMRERFRRLVGGPGDLFGCTVESATFGIDGLLVVPSQTVSSHDGRPRRIVWLHGGGYVFGAPETHLRPAARLAARAEAAVFLPRYRLAPEHPWPAQRDDALVAARAARADGDVVLAGDSAGGHLALVTALALAGEGAPLRALLLMSPNTDRSGRSDTRERNDPLDPMVDDAGDRAMARTAFGDFDPHDPEVSPLLGDLAALPPLHVEVGETEVLLGDSLLLARGARNRGAEAHVHVDPDGLHMGQAWTPYWPNANASLDRLAAFALQHMPRGDAVVD